ncbi:MAG TPA: hypothetical protein VGN18_18220 [Jatrophihabitans sp.]|nr:hypothetical protein [Jatrophihabitans sp.]
MNADAEPDLDHARAFAIAGDVAAARLGAERARRAPTRIAHNG